MKLYSLFFARYFTCQILLTNRFLKVIHSSQLWYMRDISPTNQLYQEVVHQ
ncbi:hypothetical protein LC593_09720 [Nostoc sp. CHAB 5844]|nr:hypothetical protein [Nostoc sp. CHAB 5844]